MFQVSLKGVVSKIVGCSSSLKGAARVFERKLKGASRKLQECLKKVSRVFQGRLKGVSRECSVGFKSI